MIVLIDNFDSFTYNLYDYLKRYTDVVVIQNNQKLESITNIQKLKGIVVSPGPSHPSSARLSLDAIDFFGSKVPILGVCLGMQAIAYVHGKTIKKARSIMHGKKDKIKKLKGRLFNAIPDDFYAVRYHSLVVDDVEEFEVCAISQSDGEIMAIENNNKHLYGLQFHPESYETQYGLRFIENFLEVCNESSI